VTDLNSGWYHTPHISESYPPDLDPAAAVASSAFACTHTHTHTATPHGATKSARHGKGKHNTKEERGWSQHITATTPIFVITVYIYVVWSMFGTHFISCVSDVYKWE
jgi:hypothetical protein